MASEFEEAAEVAQDLIKEKLSEESEELSQWMNHVALSTMVMALLVAIGVLLAGFSADDLMIERTEEILEKSSLESDRLDIEVLKSKHAVLLALDKVPDPEEIERIRTNQKEMEELNAKLETEQSKFENTLFEHQLQAIGVTLLSIALTLSGMAVIVKRKNIWKTGLVFGVIGTIFLVWGTMQMIF